MAQKLNTRPARRRIIAARQLRAFAAMKESAQMARAGCFSGTEEASALYQKMCAERDRQKYEPFAEEPKP